MADKKFTEFVHQTTADVTDYIVGLFSSDNARFQFFDLTKRVWLSITGGYDYKAGQLSYDATTKTGLMDTGYDGVRVNIGLENYNRVYNDTGVTIVNGTPVMTEGSFVSGVPSVVIADADSEYSSTGFRGVVTADILDGAVGLSTWQGDVNDVDTSSLSLGNLYIASGGGLTNTAPTYPAKRVIVGDCYVSDASVGVINVTPSVHNRELIVVPSTFTSNGVSTGTFWKSGFYDWETTSVALTQASTTQTYGTAGKTYAAHASVVVSGAGTVDAGQVGLRVTGIQDSETGVQVAAQTGIITEDITTLTADTYYETSEKFSGEITFELYVVSGSPTTYGLTFNYGYSKYDDIKNIDFTIASIECLWRGAAADSAFNVQLYKHVASGWTYTASGFSPGNSIIASRLIDQALAPSVTNGYSGAWKRVDLNEFIEGSGSDGFLIKVTTGSNNTIQFMDMRVLCYSEELI